MAFVLVSLLAVPAGAAGEGPARRIRMISLVPNAYDSFDFVGQVEVMRNGGWEASGTEDEADFFRGGRPEGPAPRVSPEGRVTGTVRKDPSEPELAGLAVVIVMHGGGTFDEKVTEVIKGDHRTGLTIRYAGDPGRLTNAAIGRPYAILAQLSDYAMYEPLVGKRIRFEIKNGTGAWRPAGEGVTGQDGLLKFNIVPNATSFQVRGLFDRDDNLRPAQVVWNWSASWQTRISAFTTPKKARRNKMAKLSGRVEVWTKSQWRPLRKLRPIIQYRLPGTKRWRNLSSTVQTPDAKGRFALTFKVTRDAYWRVYVVYPANGTSYSGYHLSSITKSRFIDVTR